MYKIIIAEPIGFCSGVEQAVRMARRAMGVNGRVYSLGPLIHNSLVVEELLREGLEPIANIKQAEKGTLVIRSHGCAPELMVESEKLKIKVVDATCPNVRKVQQYAKRLSRDGYTVVVVGDKTHPEVKSILAYAGKSGVVYKPGIKPNGKKIGILAQTTTSSAWFKRAIEELTKNDWEEIRVFNTICKEAFSRQEAVKEIGSSVDLMLIVGGKVSANTQRLAETVRKIGKPVYHIEKKEEIDWNWFSKTKKIGIAAGTSTPSLVIDEIVEILKNPRIFSHGVTIRLRRIGRNPNKEVKP
jgi:4-hydroxy-3-methylbut-2-enyl diphosphate reductase